VFVTKLDAPLVSSPILSLLSSKFSSVVKLPAALWLRMNLSAAAVPVI
jgi:hypothetical protein